MFLMWKSSWPNLFLLYVIPKVKLIFQASVNFPLWFLDQVIQVKHEEYVKNMFLYVFGMTCIINKLEGYNSLFVCYVSFSVNYSSVQDPQSVTQRYVSEFPIYTQYLSDHYNLVIVNTINLKISFPGHFQAMNHCKWVMCALVSSIRRT